MRLLFITLAGLTLVLGWVCLAVFLPFPLGSLIMIVSGFIFGWFYDDLFGDRRWRR